MLSSLKKIIYSLFNGRALPVFNRQLKGVKLIVDPLLPLFHFWRDVEMEGHFFYDRLIADGDIVLDVGANVGLHSIYIARKFPSSTVYSFEPLPGNANYIRKMCSINKIKNIVLIEAAVGSSSGTIYFDKEQNNHQGHITDQPTDLSVAVVSLDDFLQQKAITPSFIKIDVEGFESGVLEGFANSIKHIHPVFIIELHTPEQNMKVAEFFRNLPYSSFRIENHKTWSVKKPLSLVKNEPIGAEAPTGFWGTVLIVPIEKIEMVTGLYSC